MCCTDFHCRYDERIDRVETRIAARLRDQLGTAKSANEMFRIFSRYNALFVRSHIRGAIREYQTQLIQRVKDDIESLHNKFKVSDGEKETGGLGGGGTEVDKSEHRSKSKREVYTMHQQW